MQDAGRFSQFEWAILTDANTDAYGLFELPVSIRSVDSKLDDDEVSSVAKDSVLSLLERGLIELSWFQHTTGEEIQVTSEEAQAFINLSSSWSAVDPTTGIRYLAITATAAGVAAWKSGRSFSQRTDSNLKPQT